MLISKINNWDKGEQVVVITNRESHEDDNKKRIVQIDEGHISYLDEGRKIYSYERGSLEVSENDIITISENGTVSGTHYRNGSEVDIFITNHCNSNCIMCPLSEDVRKKQRFGYSEWIRKYIAAMPEDVPYINITGGEPTLAGEDFFEILRILTNKFQHSGFQLLTNGRSISDYRLLHRLLKTCPSGMLFAIPVHSCIPKVHDQITQAEGSFAQTDRGIKNLLDADQKVEIRIVISKLSIDTVTETARYIVSNYHNVSTVNFMAMEMMGNAAVNRERIWIDYDQIFNKIEQAVDILVTNGIDVKLYNLPLCMVKRGFWHIAVRSISSYKIQYQHTCSVCCVKDICGGFFGSTIRLMNPTVYPIQRSSEA